LNSEYQIREFSEFKNLYKRVWKQYKHTFSDDYDKALNVIKKMILQDKGNLRHIPNSDIIGGLGKEITLPVLKTRVHIKEARDTTGRLIYLVDVEKQAIFLIDIYYHPDRDNHDIKRIERAHLEYLSTVSSESQNSECTQE
jgi:hypothetical protein